MRAVRRAWERLSNATRLCAEGAVKHHGLMQVDPEEALRNADLNFELKLETFHSLYDVTQSLPGFDYFGHPETALLIVLRNAIHHWDHDLFESLHTLQLDEAHRKKMEGAALLLADYERLEGAVFSAHFVRVVDFFERLKTARVKNPEKIEQMWRDGLSFDRFMAQGAEERYPPHQVYVNIIPIFAAAIHKAAQWIKQSEIQISGFDSETYMEHFLQPVPVALDSPTYSMVRIYPSTC